MEGGALLGAGAFRPEAAALFLDEGGGDGQTEAETATAGAAALMPGAGAGLLNAAAAEGCQLFITGEMKHHEVLDANAQGVSILLAGHSNTERGYLPHLADRLRPLLTGVQIAVSKADRTLMQTV